MSNAVEPNIHVAPCPLSWNREMPAVGAHGIGHVAVIGEPTGTVSHHAVGRLIEREGICHVAVQWLVPVLVVMKSIYLPARRNIDISPVGVVVVFAAVVHVGQCRAFHP